MDLSTLTLPRGGRNLLMTVVGRVCKQCRKSIIQWHHAKKVRIWILTLFLGLTAEALVKDTFGSTDGSTSETGIFRPNSLARASADVEGDGVNLAPASEARAGGGALPSLLRWPPEAAEAAATSSERAGLLLRKSDNRFVRNSV